MVIRGGTLVDGSGAAPRAADVAIRAGRILEVGANLPAGREEIDATGLLVTPGFVDIHTHYDGQATWESRLVPSSYHGVTTAVVGNCGVGFAPCSPDQREQLVRLMEGVEDIPYPVLAQGLPWTWESFPQYLDTLAERRYDMDIAAYVPHSALRVHVMGGRAVAREDASPEDIARMCALLEQALDAGALGIATSRSLFHRSSDGTPIPSRSASDDELTALARTLRKKAKGVFQIVEDLHEPEASLKRLCDLAREAGRPLTFPIGTSNVGPARWPQLLDELAAANANGLTMKAQLLPRGIGLMLGFELTLNPFYSTPTYARLATLPLDQRLAELRKNEVRAQILSEAPDPDPALVLGRMVRDFEHMFVLGDPPEYEPAPEHSIAARAKRQGIRAEALAYDLLIEEGGPAQLYLAMANYADGSLDAVGAMLRHPDVVLGLGDGGAHVGTICDASYSTYALMHWVRDRAAGRLPIEYVVHKLTHAPAQIAGLDDRGLLAAGQKADVNVIDLDRLRLHPPEIRYDLPAGGRRLVQRSSGYVATLVAGQVVSREGTPSGTLPGQLVRVGQSARAAA